MTDTALTREQLKKLAKALEDTGDSLRAKAKKAETESEHDILMIQAINQFNKALEYNTQSASLSLTLAKKDAAALVSEMSKASKRLAKIKKVDDLVYYSGRILQAAAMIASAAAGGGPAITAAIVSMLAESADEVS
ncbi:hypothetical protein [Marinobacter salexigens]|uniref:hypothetical protein n=1 Tax=Marinobacter salexigens TaxID=1925763 RepID=UPI000C288B01|nr:hypothetical protein [Marinobacter salexigens]